MYMLQEMLISLFKAAGFTCDDYRLQERQIENRRQQVVMHRRWVQAIFTYKPEPVDPPQAAGPPLQAKASAHPVAPPVPLEEDSQPNAFPAAALLPHQRPASQNSSKLNHHSIASGDQALPSSHQHAAATDRQPAWQQQPAASQHQQPLSPDAAMLASDSRSAKHGCLVQPVDEQPGGRSEQGAKGASAFSSTGDGSQQGAAGACGVSTTIDASAPGLETQQEIGAASASSSAAQGQEWEEGGTSPDQEPITGCLFADSTLEEVLLGLCFAVDVRLLMALHTCRLSMYICKLYHV